MSAPSWLSCTRQATALDDRRGLSADGRKVHALWDSYPHADIAPLGFWFVEVDGVVTEEAVAAVRERLRHPDKARSEVDHNYELALQHYSYRSLSPLLAAELERWETKETGYSAWHNRLRAPGG